MAAEKLFGFNNFFDGRLADTDPQVAELLDAELRRQNDGVELIASENIASMASFQAIGSVLTNKYAEGYSGRRYYGGCEVADDIEDLAIARARELLGAKFVNVQPHSGSQANQAVYQSLMKPGDVLMGMSLAAGGHLTHGAAPNQSGKLFQAVQYGVRKEDGLIDFDQVRDLAKANSPKIIVAGGSAYSRIIDFAAFREIADEVGATFMVDMAHFAGLVAAKLYPDPLEHAHVVTTTTHKTLRCTRGGMILTNDEALAKKFNSAIFPCLQGGPLMHAIAGKAVGFAEALQPAYKTYMKAVVGNAQVLAQSMLEGGADIVSGGTDTHVMLVDLQPLQLTGAVAEKSLERANITCNKNGVPFDPQKPMVTSGIRLGTPAATTRGFGGDEFAQVADCIMRVLRGSQANGEDNDKVEAQVRAEIIELCQKFPLYNQSTA
ncbi:MAG: serine hydroxymethyltransferase [Pseudomonadota bacterium]